MFWNPFRRIKDLEFDVDVRDRTIENLKKEIEELKSPTRPKYHPNTTCIDCEYCIVEERENYGSIGCVGYYCRLNNNFERVSRRCHKCTMKKNVAVSADMPV